jgi:hypothetical protein
VVQSGDAGLVYLLRRRRRGEGLTEVLARHGLAPDADRSGLGQVGVSQLLAAGGSTGRISTGLVAVEVPGGYALGEAGVLADLGVGCDPE